MPRSHPGAPRNAPVRLLDPSVDPEESKSASINVSRALDEKKAYLVYLIELMYHSHLTEGVFVDDKFPFHARAL